MDTTLIYSIAIGAVLVLLVWFGRRRSKTSDPTPDGERLDTLIGWPPQPAPILRASERLAYTTLKLALPGYMILAQVPIARFISVPKRSSYAEWMRRLGSHCVDLVVCDVTSQVIAVVELRSLDLQISEGLRRRLDRVARALAAVGVPLHVWNPDALPSIEAARASIAPKSPAVAAELAARKAAAQATTDPTNVRMPFADTDREWTDEDVIEVIEMREPTAATWFDELDSVSPPQSPGDRSPQR